ncbi:methionyl-tRNA formyltransferase [Campylobacter sp. MIT 99-7217]|uniref:methionyl-tRNA formyltransferase n=1 Tax=Campylobacter sp. MIT 99-7217 TaxID=535091 RepID=UPI00115A2208|nr:methionyl-tRNA formyltransferase [Campylobacter sp. MIT 99-7217]TQR30365.1 methionyl-tRNA formyltransferase [Campylobacter sp. MIT 99-7217]
MHKKIIFMGTPAYAARILDELILNDFEILAVFTQADKPVGRKQVISMSEVKSLALQKLPKTPIFQPKSLKDENVIHEISSLKPNFIVVAAYGKILPQGILDLAPCINLHASLLPKYRGASPIQSAILNGDEKSGVCTMLMNAGLDTGDILQSLECEIKGKNAGEVFDLLANLAANLAVKTLKEFDKITPKAQDESKASLCKKIQKSDGLIKLDSAKEIYQKFLAFTPWPGIFLENGLKFLNLELVDENSEHLRAGEILALENDGFLLACKKGILKIKSLQEAGKKALEARVYLNGKRLKLADSLC